MAVRDLGEQLLATGRPATQPGHIGFGPGLIQKNQPFRRQLALVGFPKPALAGDVRTILLGRKQRFF